MLERLSGCFRRATRRERRGACGESKFNQSSVQDRAPSPISNREIAPADCALTSPTAACSASGYHSSATELLCGRWYWLQEDTEQAEDASSAATPKLLQRLPVILVGIELPGSSLTRQRKGRPLTEKIVARRTGAAGRRNTPVHANVIRLRVVKAEQQEKEALLVHPWQLEPLQFQTADSSPNDDLVVNSNVWYLHPGSNKWAAAKIVAIHGSQNDSTRSRLSNDAGTAGTILGTYEGHSATQPSRHGSRKKSKLRPQGSSLVEGEARRSISDCPRSYVVKVKDVSALRCTGHWRLYQQKVPARQEDASEGADRPTLFAQCPHGCGAVMAITSASQGPTSSLGHIGSAHSVRLCCFNCKGIFCGACMAAPYHTGYDCDFTVVPKCIYCDCKVLDTTNDAENSSASPSVRWLREHIAAAGVDCSWCVEKLELLQLWWRVQQVCSNEDCNRKLHDSCSKLLPCGHWCGGVRGEHCHPPCLHHDCEAYGRYQDASFSGRMLSDDSCAICMDALACSPCLQLPCGHLFHADCVRETLKRGYPGPEISFKYLTCSLCGGVPDSGTRETPASPTRPPAQSAPSFGNIMHHPCIEHELEPHMKLLQSVNRKGKQRLKAESMLRDAELQPGGAFDGRPSDYALSKFLFYKCAMCEEPYFGGLRACGAQAIQGMEYNPQELICYSCNIQRFNADCAAHGRGTIEWKCRYCCSTASWFCFGSQHMCDRCHASGVYANRTWKPSPCDPATCPLRVKHPPHGQEFCLGCSTCRVIRDVSTLKLSGLARSGAAEQPMNHRESHKHNLRHVRSATVGAIPGELQRRTMQGDAGVLHDADYTPHGRYGVAPDIPTALYSSNGQGRQTGSPPAKLYGAARPPGVYIGLGKSGTNNTINVHAAVQG